MAKKTIPDPEVPFAPEASDMAATDVAASAEPVVAPLLLSDPDVPQASPPQPRPGFVAPLAGGALAAMLGFGLAHFDVFGLRGTDDIAAILVEVERQGAEVATLKSALETEQASVASRLGQLETAVAGVAAPVGLQPVDDRLTTLEDRLSVLEERPSDSGGASPALAASVRALEQRMAALAKSGALPDELSAKVDEALRRLDEAEARALDKASEAEALSAAATRAAALDRLKAAVDAGVPYDDVLADWPGEAVPAALADHAATGLPTLASLQESFPDAAREVLQAARTASGGDGWSARLMDFLQAQTGARSLTPREGTDPDAVLSRAEAALREGRVATALEELKGLDPQIAGPLTDWSAKAVQRRDADAALAAMLAR